NKINWWKYSGLTIATSLLLAACSVGDIDKQIELEQEKQKTEQEEQKTSNIETSNQIKVEQEKQKTSNIEKDLVKEQKDLVKTQKDFIKYIEQNCKENHGQFFIEKGGTKAGIGGIT
ncbi:DUF874 family protein, partial [Helicobacter pylori]|uniref:DUF874 family protein n=1 Tax=Helicobacter pylori TaxID=210 RepID=UPI001BB4605D